MGQRDREFNRGGDRREGGRYRSSRERVYRSGDNQEDYSGRGGYTGGDYGDREGRSYERSRGREHLGEFPRASEERGGRGDFGRREPDMRDMDAFGGYGGRGGGYWGSESESEYNRGSGRDYRGEENRNPYYGGGGMFGGGIGGYTGGGYLGGGFGGSAIDNESEEQRAYRRQNYNDRERYDTRRSYGRGGGYREDYDDPRRGRGEGEGFFDRMADTVSSWFGGDDDDRYDYRERSHRGKGPRNYTRSDDRIREDINDQLTYHISIDASDIDVEVNGGEVVLTGNVRSRYEKRLAEDIVEDINGVRNVENRIRVNRESHSWGSTTGTTSHTGTSGTMSAGSGVGTESTAETGITGTTGNTTSAERTGTPTDAGTGRGRSAGGTR
jgi:osmotically-inducible protein OsmY